MDHKSLARLHGALSSEIRLRILELIASQKEMCVCELVDHLGMSQANISRHVSVLRDVGALQDRKIGTWVLLRVDEMAIEHGARDLLDTIRRRHAEAIDEDPVQRLDVRCSSEPSSA